MYAWSVARLRLTGVGVFLLLASLAIGRLSDMLYRRNKTNNDGKAPVPERRLEIQVWGYVASAAGKVMFGWFTLRHYHPAAGLTASAVGMSTSSRSFSLT
jgi:hypothetical protein